MTPESFLPPVLVVVNTLAVLAVYAIWQEGDTPEQQVLDEPLDVRESGPEIPAEPLDPDGSEDP